MEEERDDRMVRNSSSEEDSEDDDLVQMENIADLDSSTDIIEIVNSSPSEVLVDLAACVRDVHEEEHIASGGDDDDDLIQIENITDLDSSIEVLETETGRSGEDATQKSSHFEDQVISDTAALIRDEDDGCEGWVVRKCKVMVKKSKLCELGKGKEVLIGSDSDCVNEDHSAGDDTTMNTNLGKGSTYEINSNDTSATMSSSSTPNGSLHFPTGEGNCRKLDKEAGNVVLGKYDCFMEEFKQKKTGPRRNVRCLLCGDGRTTTHSSFARHVKALHEPTVKCKICHKEFNVVRMGHHMRKRHTVAEENNNDEKSDDTEDISATLPSVQTVQHLTSQPGQPVLVKHLEGDIIYLSMTSGTVKGVNLKMGLKKGSKIKQAMRKFGKRFKVPWTKLNFYRGDTELTGREMAEDLEGANIKVCGPF